MSRATKLTIFGILLFSVVNFTVIWQDSHRVFRSRILDVSVVFWEWDIQAIWIGETMYIPAEDEDYLNL
jgi:hypothetical protein